MLAYPTDDELRALFLAEPGYATGAAKLRDTPLPGCKSFAPWRVGNLQGRDLYAGGRETAGITWVTQIQPDGSEVAVLQRHYGGGCRSDLAPEQVAAINEFWPTALAACKETARLPADPHDSIQLPEASWASYLSRDGLYAYFGYWMGTMTTLHGMEGIFYRKKFLNEEWHKLFGFPHNGTEIPMIWPLIQRAGPVDLVAYHEVTHRKITSSR